MSRHDTDLTSLIAGLVFLALGVTYLLDAVDVVDVEVKWAVPLTLIGLGLAGLAGSVQRAHQDRPPRPDDADGTARPAAADSEGGDGGDGEWVRPQTPAV